MSWTWKYRKEYRPGSSMPWVVYAADATMILVIALFTFEESADQLLAHLNREQSDD